MCFHSLRTLILSPDPELSTPTESRHTTCPLGGKSPSVKLTSRRENKELAKTNLKNMDRTMQELQHIGSIKYLRAKKVQTLTTKDCKGPQTNMPKHVGSIKT